MGERESTPPHEPPPEDEPEKAPGALEPHGLGPPHFVADPHGLGPPHVARPEPEPEGPPPSDEGQPEDYSLPPLPEPPPEKPPLPPPSPAAADPHGLGPPHFEAPDPGTPAGGYSAAPPPQLPPWLRNEPIASPAPATPPAELPAPPPGQPDATVQPPPTTQPPATPQQAKGRGFAESLVTGVLLTLAGGSAAAGGILALWLDNPFGFTVNAVICGGVALGLLLAAVLLRLVRGSDDLRGMLAVVGIVFAAAALSFAYDPSTPTDHDNLVKFAMVAGIVAVIGWFAAVVVPSAVAGFLAVIALATGTSAGVWLASDVPTWVQTYTAALGIGVALALVLPRVAMLRPHPLGEGWALAGAAIVIALPAIGIATRSDGTALAAGATAAAGLLLLAQHHRNLPAALGALAGLAALEGELVNNVVDVSAGGTVPVSRLIVVSVAGAVLIVLVAIGVLLSGRGVRLPRWRLPVHPADVLLAASLALAVVSIFTGPGEVFLQPTRFVTIGQ